MLTFPAFNNVDVNVDIANHERLQEKKTYFYKMTIWCNVTTVNDDEDDEQHAKMITILSLVNQTSVPF